MNTITVPADDRELESLLSVLEEELDSHGCPMKVIMQLQLVFEEIFVNISHYAYAPGEGTAEISLDFSDEPSSVTISFKDWGVPFNPLEQEEADVTLSASERQIGGLGIFLVRKNTDDVTYSYTDGANILTVMRKW